MRCSAFIQSPTLTYILPLVLLQSILRASSSCVLEGKYSSQASLSDWFHCKSENPRICTCVQPSFRQDKFHPHIRAQAWHKQLLVPLQRLLIMSTTTILTADESMPKSLELKLETSTRTTDVVFEEVPCFEQSIWRTIDRRILPIAALFYFLSFLVKSLSPQGNAERC